MDVRRSSIVGFERLASSAHPFPMPLVGEETVAAQDAQSSRTQTSGTLRCVWRVARQTELINSVVLPSVGAAGATPTLVRCGIWRPDTSSADPALWSLAELLTATPNDTGIYAAGNEEYPKDFSAPFAKVAGSWYVLGVLVVTAAAAPTVPAQLMAGTVLSAPTHGRPRKATTTTGQADLPASVAAGSLTTDSGMIYALLKP